MTRLTVAIRVRPLSQRELSRECPSIVSVEDGTTVAVTNTKVPEQNAGDSRERVRRFGFDYGFDCAASQEDVYRKIGAEIVGGVRTRVHSCILAYGQSASGKTHTMIGDAPHDEGVVPRLCREFFRHLAQAAVGSELENLNATVSFLEIYNEKVRDLLNVAAGDVLLKVREHPKTGPYVQGLSEQSVSDSHGLLSLLHAGNANRTIGATNANPRSSRSHSVFTITCLGGLKLKFVDLAGSERAGSHTTSRFREGANINKSLVALRNVIAALADWSQLSKVKKRFVPYRDSVLTWLLKDTLGGNSKTILISTVSPASVCYNETVNTLRFGQRAKQIAVQPFLNEDPKERTIRELRAEIAKLREQLEHVHEPLAAADPAGAPQESSDSDSGVSACDRNSEPEASAANVVDVRADARHVAVEKLYPLIEVTATMADADEPKARALRRTYSVDHRADSPTTTTTTNKHFSSQEALPISGKKTNASNPPAKSVAKKGDARPKIDARPKVDAHRKPHPKPRSQIVAAVTQRLYNKVKKKEVATDTLDLSNPARDLTIASNARLRLQELTQKALRAHRRKHAETQTSLFPVLRYKEVGTDVADLRLLCAAVAHIEIATDPIRTNDASTNCTFLETLQNLQSLPPDERAANRKATIIVTRSCATSTETLPASANNKSPVHEGKAPLSFTKYLMPEPRAPTFEIVNPATSNPIYTSSVNINVNHNYASSENSGKANDLESGNDALSDDSLEAAERHNNPGSVCFPTPDLISNHNSLDPHATTSNNANSATTANMCYAISNAVEDGTLSILSESPNPGQAKVYAALANCALESPRHQTARASVETQYAPQMCVSDKLDDDCHVFYKAPPRKYRSNVAHDHLNDPILPSEPVILKSIMKCGDATSDDCDSESIHVFDNIPDSLNYYYEKRRKTVRFDSPTSSRSSSARCQQDERMMDVMAGFMKEVTTLMTNLTKVASRLEPHENAQGEQTYDMHVVVNDIQGLNDHRCDHCCSQIRLASESTQTLPVSAGDCSAEAECEEMPENKFESLLESSCRRLEATIQKSLGGVASHEQRDMYRNQPPHMLANIPDWNYRNAPEDSSIESQPTFSDYGSLPRRRNRPSFASPSSYLRQLTNMRREVVRTSRDELLHEADIHL